MTTIYTGSFWEGGPANLVGLLKHPDDVTLMDGNDTNQVTTWSLRVYDEKSATPDTAVWALTAQDPAVDPTPFVTKTTGKYVLAAPNGYNFLKTIRHDESDGSVAFSSVIVGGNTYRFELVIISPDALLDNATWVWVGEAESRSTPN